MQDICSTLLQRMVFFKHKYLTNPSTSPTDALIAAAANLAHVIQHNAKAQHIGVKKLQDIQCLQQLFSETAKQQLNPPAPPAQSHAPPPRVPTPTPLPTLPVVSDDEGSDDELESFPRVPTHCAVPLVLTSSQHTQPSRSLTYETMLHILSTRHNCITTCHATQRCYPNNMLNAVLNDKTAQGITGIVNGTNTIVFIHKTNRPQDRWKDVTYRHIVANFCPEKDDLYRIRLKVGGNCINFPGDCGTPTADMITVKILLNSVISTKNAKFMAIDIKDFYLIRPMACPEFMRLKLPDIPTNIIELYKLHDITHDVYVLVRIQKGMYGLPQARIIAQQLLKQRLQANGYRQSKINPGFWTHDW
eukprot:CCRYP_001279-RA/>CCRYP_001279-RA protein AED:0.33 eAED:0.33 QI:0/0/0/1/0/0/3/0/359